MGRKYFAEFPLNASLQSLVESFGLEPGGQHQADFKITAAEVLGMNSSQIKRHLYRRLNQKFPGATDWGTLVGVRPTKLAHSLLDSGFSISDGAAKLQSDHLISAANAMLLMEIAATEKRLPLSPENAASLYISVPFCPTRCSYCSFPAVTLSSKGHLMEKYIDELVLQISQTLEKLYKSGRYLDCMYIGGGTPAVLSAHHAERIYSAVFAHASRQDIIESTFEAGRTDVFESSLFAELKNQGVDRVCVNPQSFDPDVLKRAGRPRSPREFADAMQMVRSFGFKVNADLILGLGGETQASFKEGVRILADMAPENITIHALALKKGSKLQQQGFRTGRAQQLRNMRRDAGEILKNANYLPYYLYRQKQIAGNLENIGYSLPSEECIYNSRIINESSTILACGVGAVGKIVIKGENRHERLPNHRQPEQFIASWRDTTNKLDTML